MPRRRRGGSQGSRLTLAAARPAALLAAVLALAPSPAAGEALAPGLSWTTEVRPDGPLRLNVIALDRAVYAGRLTTVLSNGTVLGRETVSSMAIRHGALAAVNGTYYVVGGPDDGDPVGAVVAGGRLVSEPVDGREALVVPADRAAPVRLERLAWSGRVTVGARTRLLDGIERERGVIWGCGGRGGDQPGERPRHGVPPCRDPSELVALSPAFGARTPPAGREATEAAVRIERADGAATSGTVVAVRRGGSTPIPRDGLVLSGSGDAAALLAAARRGDPVRLATALRAGGRVVDPGGLDAILVAGPRLVRDGRVAVRSGAEGFSAPGLYERFVLGANPRTLAGVTAAGTLLLVTVDGRAPGFSAGVSLPRAAELMRDLGARDAVNLDGGGSTTMAIRGAVVNRPSDRVGERPVGEGVLVLAPAAGQARSAWARGWASK
ncbi:MAG TPA: phosphodiester glycosidase family protein [Solirubrobacteraceae bacterium]|nr:phosphodiester glycosidase family protein [Solirubrobacteraceae bacterium]